MNSITCFSNIVATSPQLSNILKYISLLVFLKTNEKKNVNIINTNKKIVFIDDIKHKDKTKIPFSHTNFNSY
jgi:hypothetical protein